MYINAASHYLPGTFVPNEYYTQLLGLTDDWIFKRSGIRKRTKVQPEENTNTMSIEAVKSAIGRLPYPLKDIDLVVGATYTPYDTVGTLAHAVQSYFGIGGARVVSISSACSSFLNGIEIVEGYFAANKARRAVVIASEHNSAYNDDQDEQSGHLWGDGAGAVFISKEKITGDEIEILDVNTTGLGDIGKSLDAVYLRPNESGLRMPCGRDIFVYATRYMVSEVERILARNGFSLDDIIHLIPHQANLRIINHVGATLGLRDEQLIMNIENTGNTGCASTAIAISQNWERFRSDELIVVTVFGGGYSSGAMLLKR
ncbi:MAG: ketoacyl-ACP synthase III [Syntrophobacterales bacterium]|jgi:3-oxoacyl-[acyl-carrier-protein] synthase-3|nr:ketoacyl-ACP synthase III [Syntrophobacterales bacterium]